jgi:hypothetical protein
MLKTVEPTIENYVRLALKVANMLELHDGIVLAIK